MNLPSTFEELIKQVEELSLYAKLIVQLNKDLRSANIDLELHDETPPLSLKLILQEEFSSLIRNNFSKVLNLFYSRY